MAFPMGSEDQSQALIFEQQLLYWLSHLSSLDSSPWILYCRGSVHITGGSCIKQDYCMISSFLFPIRTCLKGKELLAATTSGQ